MLPGDSDNAPIQSDQLDPIRDLTALALVHALEHGARTNWLDPRFQNAFRQACEYAKQRGLHAEQLIVHVREAWTDGGGRQSLGSHAAEDVVGDVITLLIREFYLVPDDYPRPMSVRLNDPAAKTNGKP